MNAGPRWPSLAQPDCGDYAPCVLRDGHEGDHEVYDDATGRVTRVPRADVAPGRGNASHKIDCDYVGGWGQCTCGGTP